MRACLTNRRLGLQTGVYSMTVTPLPSNTLRLISTADYHRMAEVGILTADEQVELISGHIVQKMPKGPAHRALCRRMEKLLQYRLKEQAI